MPRFYVDLPLNTGLFELPEAVVRHINVLRMRENDLIVLFNGNGYDYNARITTLGKRKVTVAVLDNKLVVNEAPVEISLLASILASDKMDLMIQKAVELGVSSIYPIYSQNTQRFNSSRLQSRMEHWQKIIISASEQCGRATLTKFQEPLEYNAAIELNADYKFILSPHHQSTSIKKDAASCKPHILLLVGPEGGLCESEVEQAKALGFQSLLLGARILRAETAAFAGISCVQMVFGDFKLEN